MKAKVRTFNLFNDVDYLATAQTLAGAGAVILLATAKTFFAPQGITITSAGDESDVDFTIVGLDQNGVSQSEVLAGSVGAATVTSTKKYTKLTSVTASAAVGNATSVGLDGLMEFNIPVNPYAAGFNVAVSEISGGATFTVKHGYVNALKPGFAWTDQNWITASGLSAKTASTDLYYTGGVFAFQLTSASPDAGATVLKLTILERPVR